MHEETIAQEAHVNDEPLHKQKNENNSIKSQEMNTKDILKSAGVWIVIGVASVTGLCVGGIVGGGVISHLLKMKACGIGDTVCTLGGFCLGWGGGFVGGSYIADKIDKKRLPESLSSRALGGFKTGAAAAAATFLLIVLILDK